MHGSINYVLNGEYKLSLLKPHFFRISNYKTRVYKIKINNLPEELMHAESFCRRDGTDTGKDSCAKARESTEIPGRQILSHNTGSCTASAGVPCASSHVLCN
jgi:hypothetical protein